MKTLNQNQLVEIVRNRAGALAIGLEAVTDCRARKTGNPFGKIFKRVRAMGFIGADYQQSVEREAVRQGADAQDFVAESLPWGKWLIPNKIIEHNGRLYLRTQTTPGNRRTVAARVLEYRSENGQVLTKEQVKPFLPESRESAKQQEDAELTETVWVRTYALDSLRRVRINGCSYKIE